MINQYKITGHIATETKLFTTEDGKDIYKGDEYWYIDEWNNVRKFCKAISTSGQRGFKYFSTAVAAKRYKDKVLCVTEVEKILQKFDYPKLNEKAYLQIIKYLLSKNENNNQK